MSRVTLGFIIIGSIALTALSFLIPVADTVRNAFQAHLRTAIALLAMLLFTGAALWFLVGVRRFAPSLRVAYAQLGVGLVMFSFALLQLPIFGLFDLWETAWAKSGGVVVIFVGAAMLIYLGMRRFMRLLEVRSWVASFWKVTLLFLIIAVTTYIAAPSLIQYANNEGVDIYLAVAAVAVGYIIAATWLTHRIQQVIGAAYRTATSRLLLALSALSVAGAHEYVTTYFMNNGTPYNDYGFYLLPFVLAAFCMLVAAHSFSADRLSRTATAKAPDNEAVPDNEYIDSILTVAELASRPQDIEPIVDELRQVTAHVGPGNALASEDKQRLLAAYQRLEEFYTSGQDPLRTYTHQELRDMISSRFARLLDDESGDELPIMSAEGVA